MINLLSLRRNKQIDHIYEVQILDLKVNIDKTSSNRSQWSMDRRSPTSTANDRTTPLHMPPRSHPCFIFKISLNLSTLWLLIPRLSLNILDSDSALSKPVMLSQFSMTCTTSSEHLRSFNSSQRQLRGDDDQSRKF